MSTADQVRNKRTDENIDFVCYIPVRIRYVATVPIKSEIRTNISTKSNMNDILPDLLRPNLDLVICGTAVGTKSSKVGSYYAGRDNKFWSILEETGLTPYRIRPDNFDDLTEFGIDLTDLAKKVSGVDSDLNPSEFDTVELRRKIKEYQPFVVGFNGKKVPNSSFMLRQ